MPVLGIFPLLYLWQSVAVRNVSREDWACTTAGVAGGRGLYKLAHKACCSGKCTSRTQFLNLPPLILMTPPLAYFLQAQFLPEIFFFSL